MSNQKLATQALHAGHDTKETLGTRAVPIYQTSSYVFDNTDHAANLFSLKELGFIYTRLNNPTNDILQKRLAAIEGILILNDKRLLNLMDYKIFIDAPENDRLQRRLNRDIEHRGRTKEEVTKRYLNTLKPMHGLYIEPCKKKANMIIFNGNKTNNAFELLKSSIEQQL